MPPKSVRGGFSRGAKCIPNKYAETNISAKFEAFIRDVNTWLIFYPIFLEYLLGLVTRGL